MRDNLVGIPGTGCIACGDNNADSVGGVCFDCQEVVNIITKVTDEGTAVAVINKLRTEGYMIVDKGFVQMAQDMGVPHR